MSETRQGMVTVAESGSGPYSQLVHAGRHVLSADEPEASGCHDVGPSPYEYLLAGLGACTAMTLRSYVRRHNWGLRRTTVELWHETRPAADGKSMIYSRQTSGAPETHEPPALQVSVPSQTVALAQEERLDKANTTPR